MAAVGYGADRGPESEPEPSGEAAPRRWSSGARLLVAAAAVVLLLGVAAVGVIIADPDRLGMTYSGQPDGTRPDGTLALTAPPDGTRPTAPAPTAPAPTALGPVTAAVREASLTRTRLGTAAAVRVPRTSNC